jgi:circadian clock protein KaiC
MKNPSPNASTASIGPAATNAKSRVSSLPKTPTGIQGLDEITFGGLPRGRPTLVCGSAGCGKTLLAMEFLVNGAMRFNEPGVFMAFEESEEDLRKCRFFGIRPARPIGSQKIADRLRLHRAERD